MIDGEYKSDVNQNSMNYLTIPPGVVTKQSADENIYELLKCRVEDRRRNSK